MKALVFSCLFTLSLNGYSFTGNGICQSEMTALNLQENAWELEHNDADVETTLLDKKGVVQAIDDSNTDLEQRDIDEIMAFIDEPGIEYYSFFTNVPYGSGATLVMVNTSDCSILARYSVFEE